MFAGIFVKSKQDGMVGESVQSLTKLIKTQQLMNTCGKCLSVFPQLRKLVRKACNGKTLLLQNSSCTLEPNVASMAVFTVFIPITSAGSRSSFLKFFVSVSDG